MLNIPPLPSLLPDEMNVEPKVEIWNRECCEWRDHQKIYLGYDTAPVEWFDPRFEVLRKRTNWLKLIRCRHCTSLWYVAIDTIDDDYYFQRLSQERAQDILQADLWPTTFDQFRQFWPDSDFPKVLDDMVNLPKPEF